MKNMNLFLFALLLTLTFVQAFEHQQQMPSTQSSHLRRESSPSSERRLTGNLEVCLSNYTGYVSAFAPSAAYIPSGGLVVVWGVDTVNIETYTNYYSIQGVLYNSEGNIVGGSFFTVSPQMTTNNYPRTLAPNVVVLSNSHFAVIWGGQLTGGTVHQIWGQIYSEAGVPMGSNFEISSAVSSSYNEFYSQSSSLSNGEFVVCWNGESSTTYSRVYCQIVGSTGSFVGSLIIVDSDSLFSASNGEYASVATLKNGNFVVTWNAEFQSSAYQIYAKIYTSGGAQVGPYILISSDAIFTGNNQIQSTVCILDNGEFSVNWEGLSNLDSAYQNIYGKTFSSSGSSTSSAILVSSGFEFIKATQDRPNCASLGNGEYVRVWPNSYGNGMISTQIFSNNNMPIGNPNSIAISGFLERNYESWVISGNNGEYIVVWAGSLYQSYNMENTEIWGEQFNSQGVPTKWVFPALSGSSGLSGGQIAGIVIGSIVGAVLIGILIYILHKRMLEKRKQSYKVPETKKPAVEDSRSKSPAEKVQVPETKKPDAKSPPDKAPAPEETPILSSPKETTDRKKSEEVPDHEWLKKV